MTQRFQKFTKRYVNVLGVFIGVAYVISILLTSGCMSGSPNTPARPPVRPTSIITSPTAGATVITGTTVSITGTASVTGGGTVARVEVSVDGGANFSAATGTTAWSFNWTPTTPGPVRIRSRAVDNNGNAEDPPAEITVTAQDKTPPTSTITSPKPGAVILTGTTVSITGTASDAGGGTVAKVEVSVDGGATFSAATGTTAWSFNWTPAPGQATIRSRATDNSGNVQNPPAQIPVKIVVGGTWTAQGPGPIQNGQVENITPNKEVVGAIQTVAAHPTDANILYVGGVSGGIWRTGNAKAASPHWTPLIDDLPSLSISALEFDPTDPTHRTLVAGIGRFFSSFRRYIGPRTGVLLTTDGGDNWTQISNLPLMPQDITGVAARGATLLATAFAAGVMRSANGGASWVQVSGGNGLPFGPVYDLASDPNNLNRFYVTVLTDGNSSGIFRSDDGGATWANISSGDPTLHVIINDETHANAKMAVGSNGRLYVVVNNGGSVQYIGFTDNPAAGAVWTAMDLPQTRESDGHIEGLLPGGITSVYLSIAADPNDPNTVYVGGERQNGPFPNFIEAHDFSGRLFRGDTRVAPTGEVPSPQWEHLTHSNSIQQIPEGGTASGSAPHAGSRDMVIDASGDLIEIDEGGIYRRTSPLNNTGDWFSINADIQTTEFHDIAYDTNSNTIIGGAQGNGISQQIAAGSTTWRSVSGGNGGDVAVDNITLAASNLSIRYSSSDQSFINLRREIYDADNNRVGDPVFLATVGGTWPLFVTPVELNAINPRRLVIGGVGSVFESFDQGDSHTSIDCPGIVSAIAYGGRSDGVDNPDVLYVGARVDTPTDLYPATVFLRTTAGGALEPTAKLPAGGFELRDVVMDPDDWRSAYVVVDNQVFRTTDAGASWTDITGNLRALGARDFFTTVFVAGDSRDLLLVGTNAGVYVSFSDSGFNSWNKLGTGLPNAQVWDLDYDVSDDVLVAGTLGRGAWTITNLRDLTRLPPGLQSPTTTPAHALPGGNKR